jgi:hypothetical protein
VTVPQQFGEGRLAERPVHRQQLQDPPVLGAAEAAPVHPPHPTGAEQLNVDHHALHHSR